MHPGFQGSHVREEIPGQPPKIRPWPLAAVGVDDPAGHEAGGVRAQVEDGGGDVLGLAHRPRPTPLRSARATRSSFVVPSDPLAPGAAHAGDDESRGHGVDPAQGFLPTSTARGSPSSHHAALPTASWRRRGVVRRPLPTRRRSASAPSGSATTDEAGGLAAEQDPLEVHRHPPGRRPLGFVEEMDSRA